MLLPSSLSLSQVTAGGSATAYTPNALNQYTQVAPPAPAPVAMPSYDAKGNLTGDGTRTYAYDAENRLTQATGPSLAATYTYDPLGRRTTQTVNGVTTRFLYDGDQVLAETDAAGNIVARYLYGPGIDEPLRMERGGTVSWYHADGLGSTVALTDSTGAVTERCAYDIFGQPRITDAAGNPLAQSAAGNRCLFTGREWDAETGLYHYRARAYSPTLGRFLQRDPVGYSAGPNLYTYVGNNPLNFTDPLGLDKNSNRYSLDDFLVDAANFFAGTGDALSWGATDWIREQLDLNNFVNKSSVFYRVGEVSGVGLGFATAGVGSLNAGSRTVLYSGEGALNAALAGKGLGRILEETLGGRVLNKLEKLTVQLTGRQLPQRIWDIASGIFAANAKGKVQTFLRNPRAGSVYSRVERPILDFFKNTVRIAK